MRAVAPKGVTDDERALRRDLVRVLAATSMNFYAKEPEGERLHRVVAKSAPDLTIALA